MIILVSAFAFSEWMLHIRNRKKLVGPLGAVCGCVGLLVLLSYVSNFVEALTESSPMDPLFWTALGVVSLAIAGYLLWCCWYRIVRQA